MKLNFNYIRLKIGLLGCIILVIFTGLILLSIGLMINDFMTDRELFRARLRQSLIQNIHY